METHTHTQTQGGHFVTQGFGVGTLCDTELGGTLCDTRVRGTLCDTELGGQRCQIL